MASTSKQEAAPAEPDSAGFFGFTRPLSKAPPVEPPAWYLQAVSTLCAGFVVFSAQAILSPTKDEILVPPRAQRLPPEVVARWKKTQMFRTLARQTMQRTLLSGAVGVAYFGGEAGMSVLRGGTDDAFNTALAGAMTGGLLAGLLPGVARGGLLAFGVGAGGVMGLGAGYLKRMLPASPGTSPVAVEPLEAAGQPSG